MKNLFIILLMNSFLIVGCAQSKVDSQKKSKGDLTTADAILNNLKKKNKDLDEDDICIDKINGFNELFIVGYFAHDRGCGNPNYYFAGKEVTLDKKVIKEILLTANFKEDNLAAVEAYHIGVTNHYEHSLSTMPDKFDDSKHAFTEPSTTLLKGMIVSKIWIQQRSGMLPQVSFHLSTLIFELDGTLVDHQISNHFTVKYN